MLPGTPAWFNGRGREQLERWEAFWLEDGELYAEGWSRLIERCPADASVIAVHAMQAPRFVDSPAARERVVSVFGAIADVVTLKYGNILNLVEELEGRFASFPAWRSGYYNVLAPHGWLGGEDVSQLDQGTLETLTVRSRQVGLPLWISGIVASSSGALTDQLDVLAKQNHHISIWHGGAEPPYGLRRDDRSLNALWDSFIERPRLLGALGRELEAAYDSEGVTISWRPVEAGMPEILKLSAGSLGSSPDATIDTAALIDFVISHDPRLDELTLLVLAGDGPRRVRLERGAVTGR